MTITIGSLVRMDGPCYCDDPKNCHHRRCMVRKVFRDGGIWVINGYGFARKIEPDQIRTY